MLVFVTSMRHPRNATDYAYNERLLQKTLKSISAQTSIQYHIFVVGNESPSFDLGDRTTFIPVDFEPPRPVSGPHADRSGFVLDKGTKIGVGLIAARSLNPDWVMIFDADDFVHRSLTEFVHSRSGAPGWVIRRGWIYSQARNGYRRQDAFNGTCGTSYVLPYAAYGVPARLTISATQEEVAEAYGETLTSVIGAHRHAVAWFAKQGRVLRDLPFRGAVYHVDTGENHSGKNLRGVIKPWDRKLARDFSIDASCSPLASVWQCLGPRAWAQSFMTFSMRAVRKLRRTLNRSR